MTKEKRGIITILAMVIAGCAIMAVVDAVIVPSYTVKSLIKLALFLTFPLIYSLTRQRALLGHIFSLHGRRGILEPLLLGLAVYGLIIGGFFLGERLIDWSNISSSLKNSQENIFLMGAYICLVNSLLEEFFFRGFAFLMLKELTGPKFAYIFSAGLFSLYHIAILQNWFSPAVFALILIGLFLSGILFNYLNDRYQSIYASWMVHLFANLAINTVGLLLIIERLP